MAMADNNLYVNFPNLRQSSEYPSMGQQAFVDPSASQKARGYIQRPGHPGKGTGKDNREPMAILTKEIWLPGDYTRTKARNRAGRDPGYKGDPSIYLNGYLYPFI